VSAVKKERELFTIGGGNEKMENGHEKHIKMSIK
jgi:hypothetical protein